MSRPVRIVLGVLLTLVTIAALWWLWPRSNQWRVANPQAGVKLLVIVDPGAGTAPPVRLPAGSDWKIVRLELTAAARLEPTGQELALLLASIKPAGSRLALMGEGVGGWMAMKAALAKAPIERLIVVSSSATAGCTRLESLEQMPFFFRLSARGFDLRDRLRLLEVPSLIIAGADDPAAGPCTQEVASNLAGARVELVSGAGRDVLETHPAQVGRIIAEFLL